MMNCLVVDDDLVSRAVVRHIMTNMGFGVVEAVDGIEALDVFPRNDVGLVICSQEMPGLSGLDLRRQLGESLEVPFILMTSNIYSEELDKAYGLIDGYLSKPVSSAELRDVVQRLTTLVSVAS